MNLIANSCDIGLPEPFRLTAKRRVEPTLAVEAHQAVEAGTIEEKEIKRLVVFVESGTDSVVMRRTLLSEQFGFPVQICFRLLRREQATLNVRIEPDDVFVRITHQRSLWSQIEQYYTRAKKRLNPLTPARPR